MLTKKQEDFCLAVVEGLKYADAYRRCYDCEKSSAATQHRTGHALAHNPKVAARIQQLRDKTAKRAGVTLEAHLKTMELLRDRASRKTQYSAAVRAEECRAKASGLYVDIHRHEGPDGGPIQSIVTFAADDKLLAAIRSILKEL